MLQHDAKQLLALASGLCQSTGISLAISESEWSWNPVTRRLTVSESCLRRHGPEYCAGFIGHEVGHIFISRYLHFRCTGPLGLRAASYLQNSLEDPRSDTWIGRRYPGVRRWLDTIREDEAESAHPALLPSFLLFCMECCREGYRDFRPSAPETLPERVFSALEQTRDARRAYCEMLPADDLSRCDNEYAALRYYREQVLPSLTRPSVDAAQNIKEILVQTAAWRARELAVARVFPAARDLLDHDERQIAAELTKRERFEWAEKLLHRRATTGRRSLTARLMMDAGNAGGDCVSAERAAELAGALVSRILEFYLTVADQTPAHRVGFEGRAPSRAIADESTATSPSTGRGRPRSVRPYSSVSEGIRDHYRVLVRELELVLLPQRRMRAGGGYPSGTAVNLRRLMQFDARPAEHQQLWLRKTVPGRRRVAFSILVDLSGSMVGGKENAALDGTALVVEALSRLDIDFAVNGFQDELIPICDFGDKLNDELRSRLEAMPQEAHDCRPGGRNRSRYNDDGPCLEEAARALAGHAAQTRILIVISDGLPEGRHSGRRELRRVIEEIEARGDICLIGVGIGPDTEHVEQFYRHALANVSVAHFAEKLGSLVRELLLDPLPA